jgi:hypothetical protein
MQMPAIPMPQMQMPQAQVQGPSLQAHGANVQAQGPSAHAQPPQMQMPAMPPVSMAPPPAPKMPDKAAVPASGPNILLIAIFCLVAFLVGALLMVYLLKPKESPKPHATLLPSVTAPGRDYPA